MLYVHEMLQRDSTCEDKTGAEKMYEWGEFPTTVLLPCIAFVKQLDFEILSRHTLTRWTFMFADKQLVMHWW